MFLFESCGSGGAVEINRNYKDGETSKIRLCCSCLCLSVPATLGIENLAPINSRHPQRNAITISFCEQFAYSFCRGLPSLKETNQRIGVEYVVPEV